jgi:POT family proton-dependent oligopeptide transporter
MTGPTSTPTPTASASHSRSSSATSAISLTTRSRQPIDEPPLPHPNRLVPADMEAASLHSRSNSFVIDTSLHLTRISSASHLQSLPSEFLSDDYDKSSPSLTRTLRPLLHVDEHGHEYKYYLQPMKMAVLYILLVEMLERFSFYGINYTTTSYLTGEYDERWNADLPSIKASSYVSISTAVAYTTPFLGALLADNVLGEYTTILLGSLVCYIPGLLLIALTTIPNCLGQKFNTSAVQWGLLILWPIGTGMVKACVNVFGAKQFHPILQSSLIETYYVNFYMCINIGALTGGIVVPIVAQRNVTAAYFIPVAILGLGVGLFVAGSHKYVKPRPKHDLRYVLEESVKIAKSCWGSNFHCRRSKKQLANSDSKVGIGTIALVSGLVVPFNVAYAQMATTFILQGTVMKNWWVVGKM